MFLTDLLVRRKRASTIPMTAHMEAMARQHQRITELETQLAEGVRTIAERIRENAAQQQQLSTQAEGLKQLLERQVALEQHVFHCHQLLTRSRKAKGWQADYAALKEEARALGWTDELLAASTEEQ